MSARRGVALFVVWLLACAAAAAIEVDGVTVLSKQDVARALAPFQNQPPSLDTLRAAADALTALYRKQGYFLSRAYVPKGAVDRLAVVEGRLAEVDVQGNRHYSKAFLRRYLQPALQQKVARYDVFMKGLLLLNEFPDLRVRATLQPGRTTGTSDVLLTVEDGSPFHLTLDENNYGNRFIGTYRSGLAISHGNLTGVGDNLGVRGYVPLGTTPAIPFVQALYAYPVSKAGERISVSYVNGAVAVGDQLSLLDLRTTLTLYGAAWASPLLRTADADFTLSLGLFAKTFTNTLGAALFSRDELREIVVDGSGRLATSNTRTVYDVSVTQGLGRLLGGLANDNALSSRLGAGDSFTRFNFDGWHVHDLDRLDSIALHAAGQVTTAPLVVGEQFALGGPDTVRGYRPTEVIGDDGYVVNAELRHTLYEGPHSSIQGLIFVDHGGVFVTDPLPGQRPSQFLTAAGFGFRGTFGHATARLDCGFPLAPAFNSTRTSPVVYGQITTTW